MTQTSPNPLIGIGWMVLTGLCFVGVAATVKSMGGRIPPAEQAFLRYILGLVFLVPFIPTLRQNWPARRDLRLFTARAIVHALAVITWFFAMTRIPIADVTAINYLNPVFVTIGAALFLRERLGYHRPIAIGIAFIGVLIILRPGRESVELGHFAMIFTALAFASGYLIVKTLSARHSSAMIVAMLSLIVPVILAPLALIDWVWPTQQELVLLFLVALLATTGHYTMTRAFQCAPVSHLQPITFLQLIWASIIGILLFNEALDPFVLLGGTIIAGAACYIAWREFRLSQRKAKPDQAAG